jgi:flagellar protein FliL
MSDSAAPAPEDAKPAAAPGGKPSKIILALLALNLGGTGFAVFTVMTHHAEAAKEIIIEKEKTLEVTGPIFPLDPFVVNLDEPGTARYLKVTLQLELADAKANEIVDRSKQVLRDAILSHLSGLHLKDTLGASAKDALRDALMLKMEAIVGKGKVRRLFFQEFVVQ